MKTQRFLTTKSKISETPRLRDMITDWFKYWRLMQS